MVQTIQKVFFSIFVFFLFASASFRQEEKSAILKFDTRTHDFGEVEYGILAKYSFIFENTGNENLIIYDYLDLSGSAIVLCTRKSISPGEKGEIKIAVDTKKQGTFNSVILVISNAKNAEKISLRILGEVQAKPSEE